MENGTRSFRLLILLAIVFAFASSTLAAEVSQGKCMQYNKETHTIAIEEYNTSFSQANPYGESTGTINTYNVSTAEIGIRPELGDILRIAYDVEGAERVAIKVMNVSKQDLRKK